MLHICIVGKGGLRGVPPDGELKSAYPFIGITGTGEQACVGPALRIPSEKKTLFWGPLGHYKLIRVWRAMVLLGKVNFIGKTTITACWSLFHPETRCALDKKYIKELAEQFGGEEGLEAVRKGIADSFPAPEVLDVLLDTVHEHGMYIDMHEVLSGIKKQPFDYDSPTLRHVLAHNPQRPARAQPPKSLWKRFTEALGRYV